jgi:ankyrin repeat protein
METIRLLLDAGAEIEAADKNGATALHRAVRTRCAAAVRCLLDAGANPVAKNKSGSTPFHLAVQNTGRGGSGAEKAVAAQRRIVEEFLTRGVSTAIKDGNGRTVGGCAKAVWVRELLAESVGD